MRLETPPITVRSGSRRTASALARRERAARVPTADPPPVQRGAGPVSPCGAEGCLEVARLGAAFCPLHE
jgi:hypothetical protein